MNKKKWNKIMKRKIYLILVILRNKMNRLKRNNKKNYRHRNVNRNNK